MLNGWTGFLFGNKFEEKVTPVDVEQNDTNDTTFEEEWVVVENKHNKVEKTDAEVEDIDSGRSSPVVVPVPNVMEMSTFDHVLGNEDENPPHRPPPAPRPSAPILAPGHHSVAEVMGFVEKKVTKKVGPKVISHGQMNRANMAVKVQANGGGKARQRKNRMRTPSGYNNDRKCQ